MACRRVRGARDAGRATTRRLQCCGLSRAEPANLTAHLIGLPTARTGWTVRPVEDVVFLGRSSRAGASRPARGRTHCYAGVMNLSLDGPSLRVPHPDTTHGSIAEGSKGILSRRPGTLRGTVEGDDRVRRMRRRRRPDKPPDAAFARPGPDVLGHENDPRTRQARGSKLFTRSSGRRLARRLRLHARVGRALETRCCRAPDTRGSRGGRGSRRGAGGQRRQHGKCDEDSFDHEISSCGQANARSGLGLKGGRPWTAHPRHYGRSGKAAAPPGRVALQSSRRSPRHSRRLRTAGFSVKRW
jgi:hypothetical protein